MNRRLAARIAAADLIVYAPGTQHSSLFPSYLTAGLSEAIAANAHAVKLLVTNIQADAEIAGASAVDLIERAVYYLKGKGTRTPPTPALVTHYLLNDPRATGSDDTYVPLGRLDALQDPRLVRVGQYEQAGSGRHDAAKVLGPYVAAVLARRHDRRRIAVLLHDAGSPDKLAQTLLEMVRGGLAEQPADVTVFCETDAPLDRQFLASLPWPVTEVGLLTDPAEDRRLRQALAEGGFEYVAIFESSGMYNGEDLPWLVSHVAAGRLDAVWGSRRLSVRDIEESYRLKYRHRAWLGAISYAGSHVLSLAYLLLYGRYVSDTLSGARIVRVADALALPVCLSHRQVNQHLLSALLRRKAEMFEVPVHFYSLSPALVRRTTPADGLRAIGTILWRRLGPTPADPARAAAVSPGSAGPTTRVP
jgi:2-phospho-L-lactate transferase CofD